LNRLGLDVPLFISLADFVVKNLSECNSLGSGIHDWFIYAFARSHNFKWIIDNYAGMYYRQHSNNLVGVNYGLNALSRRIKLVFNGWGMRQSLIIANLVQADEYITSLISQNTFSSKLILASKAFYFRRRFIHKVYFFLSLILLALSRS
jgi:rhamnosyltransferase